MSYIIVIVRDIGYLLDMEMILKFDFNYVGNIIYLKILFFIKILELFFKLVVY